MAKALAQIFFYREVIEEFLEYGQPGKRSQFLIFKSNAWNGVRFTMGAGFRTNALNVDLSYLINSSDVNNPLENSLRFSLSFDLGEIYDDY